jgi:SAM-dependent methyltransferase
MKFKDSYLAHFYLDGLYGLELGGAAHNPFNLKTLNVDYTDDMNTIFKQGEEKLCGEKMKVDIVANGDDLPFKDESVDFVISSHVIEHFFDPIKALKEWYRVIKSGGYIFLIAPKQTALRGETRPCTKVEELIARHEGRMKPEEVDMTGYQTSSVTGLPLDEHGHWSVWNLKDFLPILDYLKYKVVDTEETDTKVSNGFTVVIKK